ncbi:SDR family oxidoreductase [Ramlibacter sp. MAHUQ-53]|uniref:SDR family oxidoreductase n=1 Tax=unclassified Ramlibacter TaxID=2617605 RepID=UPI003640E989
MIDLSGQRVLCVGGSSGIGRATAQLALQLGADVTLASRSPAKLAAAREALGGGARTAVLDVTDDAAVEAFFAEGTPWDHVVVTGSDVRIAPVRELPLAQALASFDSKFWGFYRVARSARLRPGGSLGVVAGFLATRPAPGRALMGAINGALESLVRGLALELKPVRVNAVSPAMVRTEMWAGLPEAARAEAFARAAAAYPAGCVGEPADIARQLLLLAATPYATGVVVTLDGGASIG